MLYVSTRLWKVWIIQKIEAGIQNMHGISLEIVCHSRMSTAELNCYITTKQKNLGIDEHVLLHDRRVGSLD